MTHDYACAIAITALVVQIDSVVRETVHTNIRLHISDDFDHSVLTFDWTTWLVAAHTIVESPSFARRSCFAWFDFIPFSERILIRNRLLRPCSFESSVFLSSPPICAYGGPTVVVKDLALGKLGTTFCNRVTVLLTHSAHLIPLLFVCFTVTNSHINN